MRPGRAQNRPTVRRKRKAHTCGIGCAFGKGSQPSPGEGGKADQGARGEDGQGPSQRKRGTKGGITSARGTKEKALGDPTGTIIGPPPPPPPRQWSASRRSRCPDGLGDSTISKGADEPRPSGPGPRDPLEDLKILLLRRLVEWWREIKPAGAILRTTDVTAAARTVQARSRVSRDTSRSTIESSADEARFTTVTGEEEGELGERTESQQRNLSQRARRRPRAQDSGGEYRRLCRHRRCEQGSRHAGRRPAMASRG